MGYDAVSKEEFDELKRKVEDLSKSLQALWEFCGHPEMLNPLDAEPDRRRTERV